MVQIWAKAKLWLLLLWLCIIIFWWINAFFSVQKNNETPLENDILQANIEPEQTVEDKEIIIDNNTIEEKNKEIQEVEQTIEKQAVTILFPPFYDQAMIDVIAELIEEQSWIETKSKTLSKRDHYEIFLERFVTKKSDSIDIVIAPSQRWDSFEDRWTKFELPEQLQRFYHTSFQESMYDSPITIVPVWLDPLVLLSRANTRVTIKKVRDILNSWISFWMWFDAYDKAWLSQWKEPFLHANVLAETLIKESLLLWSVEWMTLLLNNNQRDWSTMRTLSDCPVSDPICLIQNNHKDITLWFLSDTQTFDNLLLRLLPWSDQSTYPVRWRWMIINKDSSNKDATAQRIESFLTLNVETNTIPYPSWLLWATYSMLQRQSITEPFTSIKEFQNNTKLLYWTIEKSDNIIHTQPFLDAVDWTIDQKFFMQKIANQY